MADPGVFDSHGSGACLDLNLDVLEPPYDVNLLRVFQSSIRGKYCTCAEVHIYLIHESESRTNSSIPLHDSTRSKSPPLLRALNAQNNNAKGESACENWMQSKLPLPQLESRPNFAWCSNIDAVNATITARKEKTIVSYGSSEWLPMVDNVARREFRQNPSAPVIRNKLSYIVPTPVHGRKAHGDVILQATLDVTSLIYLCKELEEQNTSSSNASLRHGDDFQAWQ
ncbi:hypothetical protein F4604DRAFT_1996456 [Suillus subluteus]|nr:hypothetical protein F4604DRAFT_1996456 [Suillus subluteus]